MRDMSLKEARRKESALFSGIPWHPFASRLEERRMGIDALRKGLSDIYVHQVQAEFPGLLQKIQNQLEIKKAELQVLEENRSKAQRSHLKDINSKYKSRVDKYLSDESNEGVKEGADHLTVQLEHCIKTLQTTLNWKGKVKRFYYSPEDIDPSGQLLDWLGIFTWIDERYQSTPRYKIPGCIPQSFVKELFIEQIGPWESIIRDFSTEVSRIFQDTMLEFCQFEHDNDKLLQHKCKELVIKTLEAKMDEFRQECIAHSKYEPSRLLKDDSEKRVFENQIREARMKLLKSALARMADPSGVTNTEKLAEYLNSDRHVIFQVHDILRVIFDMALEDYMDWMAMSFLGLDYIREVMDIYNDQLFDILSDEEIKALFKPDPEAEKVKKALEDDIEKLETVLADLDAILEKPCSFVSRKKPVDATVNGSSDMPIRTKPGQGLVK